ncbi:DUF6541 family protein [Phycicoccus avicenniae]|uniref:DUF6541 family protein n=1 Tax=Phycicoccus avicenniae TaxID=2828860 RepID=UPI003D28F445
MTWWSAVPAVLVGALLLVVPGALTAWAAGVRGVLTVALAPVLSTGVLGVGAVVTQGVGLRWGLPAVLLSTAAAVAVVAVPRYVGRATPRPRAGDRPLLWWASGLGVLGGGASLALGFARGAGGVTTWPQTFDAVFHLSAARHVLTTGDGSSLTLGTVAVPGASRGFYPGAWHDLAALVAGVTDVPVVVAANVTALVVVAVAWPISLVALVRVALGPRPLLLAATGLLAAAVTASPVLVSSYGTLWPNALGTAVLPAALALVVGVLGRPVRAGGAPRATALVLVGPALAGLGLAHPNAVVSLVVLGVVAAVVAAWRAGGRLRVAGLALVPATVWFLGWCPAFDGTRRTSWPARESPGQAAGEWLTLSVQRVPLPATVAVLTVLGAVVLWVGRDRARRWLVAAHVVAGMLFVLVAGSDGAIARRLGGPWYDDAFRLAALAGVTAVPLAAVGVEQAVRWSASWVRRGPGSPRTVRAAPLRLGWPVAVLTLLVLVTGGLYPDATAKVTGQWYRPRALLGTAEEQLVARLPEHVPVGAVVAGSPWDGAALTGPIGGRDALFPHLNGRWDADRRLLAGDLDRAATRPDVCAAVRRLGVTHVLTSGHGFWAGDRRRQLYDGLSVAGHPGFVRVDSSGSADLWRITACGE